MKPRSLGFLLLLAGCGVALKGNVWQHAGRVIQRLREAPILEDAEISQTFVISRDGWLRFRLPQRGNIVRVLTTASVLRPVPEVDATSIRPGWRYSLEYRVVDSTGKVLREAPFHFRTHVTEYELPESTQRITSSFFEDRRRVPAITRRLLVPLDSLDGEHYELHLRLMAKDAELDDVAVRVACHTQRHHYDRPGLWQKINAQRKDRICAASIYPPELMSLEQRRSVLRWQWKPLPPSGLEGRDYQRREMYTHEEIEGREADLDFFPSGMILHASRRGVIPLPELPGTVRLAVERLGNRRANPGQSPRIVARWFGPHVHQRQEQVWELSADRQEFEVPFAGGILEIESTHPVAMVASWQRGDEAEPVDITPEATLARLYPCRPQAPLHYRIAHADNRATPLRVAFRCMVARVNESKAPNVKAVEDLPDTIDVRWQYVGHDGQAVGGGSVPFEVRPSVYDYIDEGEGETAISDPTFYHWCVPPKTAVIRFESTDERVRINASTRPPQLATTTFVPSPMGFDETEASEHRNWFPLRPEEHAQLLKYRDSQIVKTQPRPPEHDPRIVAGSYEWEDFQPNGAWQGRYLVEPREFETSVREEALDSTFFSVPTGEERSVNVISEYGGPIDLSIIFAANTRRGAADSSSPASPLSVFLDRQHRGTHPLRGGRGELLVRDVLPGEHLLRIDAPRDGKVLVNRIDDAGGQTQFIKRLAVRFDGTDLTFDVEKRSPGRELLVLDYYFDLTEPPSPARLEAEIVTPDAIRSTAEFIANPLLSWAATRRVFHIEPPAPRSDRSGFLLATADETVSEARRCFMTLGDNLAAGNHQLRIKGSPQQRAYIILSRTTPGPYELRKMTRQPLAEAREPDL